MRYHVLTLFPEMIEQGMHNSIMKRALESGKISLDCVQIRDFSKDERHGTVDDYPYGGGAGMLMQAQPVYDAWKSVPCHESAKTIYVSPKGKVFDQKMASLLAEEEDLIIVCGHYEGIDERALTKMQVIPVSIGDYVLTGGELPAMIMMDCISRLVPDVLNNTISAETESFQGDLLEYPQYTRPENWEGMQVPAVLLSGNHAKIVEWQKAEAEKITKESRPDLYDKYIKKQEALKVLGKSKRENACIMDILLSGEGDLLGREGNTFLAYHRTAKYSMLFGDSAADGEKLFSLMPEDMHLICTNIAELLPAIREKYDFEVFEEVYQSVYTQKEKMRLEFRDIRPLTMDDYEYVASTYDGGEAREYVKHRMEHHAMFGAYVEDKLAGFCGVHMDGSLGMLYIEPEYRRTKLGSSLSSFLVNLSLERGGVPYAHIHVDNEKSLKMQAYMGLYLSTKVIYWLHKK